MQPKAEPLPAPHQEVRAAAAHLLHRISRELREPQTQDWLTLELTMAQLKLLFYTFYRGPATVGHIAEALGVSLPSASGTIDKLVRHGMLERFDDPTDRRLVMNKATVQGSALVERLREVRRARVNQALDKLALDDIETLVRGLRVLAMALGMQERGSERAKERETTSNVPLALDRSMAAVPSLPRTGER